MLAYFQTSHLDAGGREWSGYIGFEEKSGEECYQGEKWRPGAPLSAIQCGKPLLNTAKTKIRSGRREEQHTQGKRRAHGEERRALQQMTTKGINKITNNNGPGGF
jgi:hypothetical protein